MAADAQGNVYTVDQAGYVLRRVAADGSVGTVLRREQVCTGAPPDRITLTELAWDAGRNELVRGGDMLTQNQVFTNVWRIRPDGQARRVLLAHKVGSKSPAGAQLDGLSTLAVDAQGRIHTASRVMPTDHQSRAGGSDEIGVMKRKAGAGRHGRQVAGLGAWPGPGARRARRARHLQEDARHVLRARWHPVRS